MSLLTIRNGRVMEDDGGTVPGIAEIVGKLALCEFLCRLLLFRLALSLTAAGNDILQIGSSGVLLDTMSGKYAFTKALKELRFLHCQTSEHSNAVRYGKLLTSSITPLEPNHEGDATLTERC